MKSTEINSQRSRSTGWLLACALASGKSKLYYEILTFYDIIIAINPSKAFLSTLTEKASR